MSTGRATADRGGIARADPADAQGEFALRAPRIHGELLKLGFELAQSSVASYMVKHRGPPSQGWRTFLRNHAPDIAAMDLFVVPTIGFRMLYGFVIVRLDRRDLVWIKRNNQPDGGVGCTSDNRRKEGPLIRIRRTKFVDELAVAGTLR